jgi:hypothetical protein
MNSRVCGTIGVLAGLALVACRTDPLGDLDGTPASVDMNAAQFIFALGATGSLTASILDARATPLEEPITFTSRDPTVATAVVDPTYNPVPRTSARAVVTGVTGGAATYIVVSGGGVSDSALVGVLPVVFTGALSSTTPQSGSTLSIASTSTLKFNPATVAVSFPSFGSVPIVSATADTVKVAVPYGTPAGPLTISGINVTFVPGLTVNLATASNVTPTGDFWAGDDSYQTAPDISSRIPATGQATFLVGPPSTANSAICPEVVLGFGSSGPCSIFKFTVAAATAIQFRADWTGTAGNPDTDIMVCSDTTLANFDPNTGAPCNAAGFGGAGSSKPETTAPTNFAPGTYWFVIETYFGTASPNYRVTLIRP